MSSLPGDTITATSAGDTFDPSLIVNDTFVPRREEHGHAQIRGLVAPLAAGSYTIIVKFARPWKDLPGGSTDANGWTVLTFGAGEGIRDVHIVEIKKDGSTAGVWTVFS